MKKNIEYQTWVKSSMPTIEELEKGLKDSID